MRGASAYGGAPANREPSAHGDASEIVMPQTLVMRRHTVIRPQTVMLTGTRCVTEYRWWCTRITAEIVAEIATERDDSQATTGTLHMYSSGVPNPQQTPKEQIVILNSKLNINYFAQHRCAQTPRFYLSLKNRESLHPERQKCNPQFRVLDLPSLAK